MLTAEIKFGFNLLQIKLSITYYYYFNRWCIKVNENVHNLSEKLISLNLTHFPTSFCHGRWTWARIEKPNFWPYCWNIAYDFVDVDNNNLISHIKDFGYITIKFN